MCVCAGGQGHVRERGYGIFFSKHGRVSTSLFELSLVRGDAASDRPAFGKGWRVCFHMHVPYSTVRWLLGRYKGGWVEVISKAWQRRESTAGVRAVGRRPRGESKAA